MSDSLDYRKLWEDFKGDLEVQSNKCKGDQINGYKPTLDAEEAQELFDRMNQAETLAMFKGGV